MFSILNYRPENSLGEFHVPVWTHSESRRKCATNTTGLNPSVFIAILCYD